MERALAAHDQTTREADACAAAAEAAARAAAAQVLRGFADAWMQSAEDVEFAAGYWATTAAEARYGRSWKANVSFLPRRLQYGRAPRRAWIACRQIGAVVECRETMRAAAIRAASEEAVPEGEAEDLEGTPAELEEAISASEDDQTYVARVEQDAVLKTQSEFHKILASLKAAAKIAHAAADEILGTP